MAHRERIGEVYAGRPLRRARASDPSSPRGDFHAWRFWLSRAPPPPLPAGEFVLTAPQAEGVDHLIASLCDQQGMINAGSMGSGKTLQALVVADALAGEHGRVLILAPRGMVEVWVNTARKSHPMRDVRSIRGGASADTIASFMTGKHWLVVSYEYYTGHYDAFLRHGGARIPLVVCDEAHKLGGCVSQRYVRVRACPADKLLLLTATPCANSLRTLWPLLNLCSPGVAGEEKWWVRAVVGPIERDDEGALGRIARSTLAELTGRFVLRRVAMPNELPTRSDYIVLCQTSERQRQLGAVVAQSSGLARAQAQLLIATHPFLLGTRSAPTPIARATGVVEYLSESIWDTHELFGASPKLTLFVQLMIAILTKTSDKVVVFSSEIKPLELFITALERDFDKVGSGRRAWQVGYLTGDRKARGNKKERETLVARFNDERETELRVLAVSTAAGGVGLSFHGANRALVIFSSHSPTIEFQALGRLHRRGQTKEVYQYWLVTEGSADELQLLTQMVKNSVEQSVFDESVRPTARDHDRALGDAPRPTDSAGSLQEVLGSERLALIADPILSDCLFSTTSLAVAVHDFPQSLPLKPGANDEHEIDVGGESEPESGNEAMTN